MTYNNAYTVRKYLCCVGTTELIVANEKKSSPYDHYTTIMYLHDTSSPYNASKLYVKQMTTPNPGSPNPHGFMAHDGFVDETRGKFIVTGMASFTGTLNHLAFIVVTPGSPPTFDLRAMNQAPNLPMEMSLYTLNGANLITPASNLAYFGMILAYNNNYESNNQSQILLKISLTDYSIQASRYLTGFIPYGMGKGGIRNITFAGSYSRGIILSDGTISNVPKIPYLVNRVYIPNAATNQYFRYSYILYKMTFSSNGTVIVRDNGNTYGYDYVSVQTSFGERIFEIGILSDDGDNFLYYNLINPSGDLSISKIHYTERTNVKLSAYFGFYQKKNNEGIIFLRTPDGVSVVMVRLSDGRVNARYDADISTSFGFMSQRGDDIYLHYSRSGTYVKSSFSLTNGATCSDTYDSKTGNKLHTDDFTEYRDATRIFVNSPTTTTFTMGSGTLVLSDATATSWEEDNCGSFASTLTNPMATYLKLCNNATLSTWDLGSLIRTSHTSSCTIPHADSYLESIYISDTTLINTADNTPITWMSLSSSGVLTASNIPCSLTNNYTISFKANLGVAGSSTEIQFIMQIDGQRPLINDTVADQSTTALNSSISYNVSTMFKNGAGFSSPLTYSATLADGNNLPSWISFDATTKIFTITTTAIQTATVKLICTNNLSNNKTQEFTVSITNNQPNVASSMGTVTHEDNRTYTETFNLAQVFQETDPNQVLTFSLVSFPAFVTATISGSNILTVTSFPSSSDVGGTHRVQVLASDSFSSRLDILTIVVIENTPPTQPVGLQTSITGYEDTQNYTAFLPFVDAEGNGISYNVVNSDGSPLNTSWITFDHSTRNLTYTPYGSLTSPMTFTLTVGDAYNTPSNTTITMTIKFKPKDNPAIVSRLGEFVALSFSYFQVPNNIITDDAAITSYWVTLDDGSSSPPSWLTITYPDTSTSGHFEFSGTYPTFLIELIPLRIYARDADNLVGYASIQLETKLHCHISCLTCDGPTINDCLSCDTGRFLYQTVCKTVCPNGYYGESSDNTCQLCNQACKTCNGSTDYDCTECQRNATHTYYENVDQCVTPCPTGKYGDDFTYKCENCHSFCTECYGGLSTQCTACAVSNRYTLVSPDTCLYLVCPQGTFYNSTTNSCNNCHDSCKECIGPNYNNCTSCPFSRFISESSGICQLCTEINDGLQFQPLSNTCLEQCGKGYNLGFIECDDSNTISGDGCSALCTIETDWKCEGGSTTTPDTCISLIGPTAELTFISSSTYLASIAFSENVTFGEYSEGDITISIDGPLAPYEFNFTINSTTEYVTGQIRNRFKIQFEFLSSLAGEHKEKITVTFNKPELFTDADGNILTTSTVDITIPFFKVYISEEEKAAASTQSSASLLSLILALGSSTLISVALGGTVEATWLLFGSIQLMSFVPLFNMNLPGNFREFSKNLAVLHGEPAGLPNLFEYFIPKNTQPFNNYFELMEFKTEKLLHNSGRKIELWGMMFLGMGISFVLFDTFGESFLGKIIRMIDTKVRYGLLIRSVSQFYLSFCLCSVLDIYTLSWSGGDTSYISNISAMVGMLFVMYIPIKSFEIVYRTGDLNSEDFKKRYKTIIAGLKTSGPLCFQFISIFYFRRAVYASIFVLFESSPGFQLVSTITVTLCMAVFLIIIRPYDSLLSIYLSILNEFLLVMMISGCFRFLNPTITPSLNTTLGTAFVGIVIGTIIINWVSIIFYGIGIMIQKYFKHKKTQQIRKFKNIIMEESKNSYAKLKKLQ